jgi:hypothetical protein
MFSKIFGRFNQLFWTQGPTWLISNYLIIIRG